MNDLSDLPPEKWIKDPDRPPPDFFIINPVDLQSTPVKPREWIVADWLPVGTVTADYGDGGTGKTLLAQQLMTSCATRVPWCGMEVMPCRSIGLFCEDDAAELHRRQASINDAFRIGFTDLADMRWISGVGRDNTLIVFTADGRMHATKLFDDITHAAKDFGARLVVLDTAADLFAGNENDRHQVRQFISLLSGLAVELNGAVLLNAHPSRAGISTGNLDGGSTAWNNSVRSRWSLARPAADGDAEPDSSARILTRRKANYASIGDDIQLRWETGVLVTASTAGAAPGHLAAAEIVFMNLLDRFAKEQRRVSESKNAGNFAPKVFSRAPDRAGFGRKDFEQAMAALFAAGRIKMETYGRTGDARQQVVRVPDSEGPQQ